ncbi:tetratricopeptide repeat protein (plasmid) [Streptomyces sp. NBC_00841]|uniref:tetratricopeptide repeat protein n=1 Tax=unclassified Streptomyces TaxID=2593676 RepID=UPI002252BF49|nr:MULTISPECIES: tetratricopeptide repeat protein [unclassified Streptomyces]MCX4537826.1 tetratricopeptide repeat protein [Streptomyces sp. NBC_01669]WSA05048.1 tetratricopeptide repeat protein [Streptomyces sp. NBC_00841]
MRDEGRSVLFARYQNPLLAAEARKMSMSCIDISYLRWLTGEEDPERAWEMYFGATQPQVRKVLDGLLATFPPEERDRAIELAGSVEAFCLPSNEMASRVFQSPGEATGYLIGISPLVVQLSADIAWGMNMLSPYAAENIGRTWDAAEGRETLDLQINEYVRALEGIGEAPMPTSAVSIALENRSDQEWPHGQGPQDYREAAIAFVLAHELAHIQHGDLSPAEETRRTRLFPREFASLLQISDEVNEELIADASTFVRSYNYFLGTWFFKTDTPGVSSLSPRRIKHELQYQRVALNSARRATEACEAYYTTVTILGMIAWRRGDDGKANRLLATAMRAPYVQVYIQRDRQEEMAPKIGSFLWTERDVAYRRVHFDWRFHFICDVMPQAWRRLGLDVPDTLPDISVTGRNLADLLEEADVVAAAAAVLQERLASQEPALGHDHPDVLETRQGIAWFREKTGDTAGAVAAYAELLTDLERVLGRNNRSTLAVRHNLAWLRGRAGDTAGATAAFAELLADQERVMGHDNLEVLETRHELAWLRGKTGDERGAAAAFAELVADFERVAGPDHAATRAARDGLAHWREETGDATGAATRLLAEREQMLGPGHADTLAARQALADLQRETGDLTEAATVAEELFADQERVLGPDHPDTLSTLARLARWRGEAGDAVGAAAAYADLLAGQQRVLGRDHPITQATWGLLGFSWGMVKDTADSAEELFAVLERALGRGHPISWATRTFLTACQGTVADAAEKLFTVLKRGDDPSDIFATRTHLAYWRGMAGDAAGAAATLKELLADQERILGPDHPKTFTTWNHLAYWRGKARDATGPGTTLSELFADQERTLGPDHPNTLRTRRNLAICRGEAGDEAGTAAALEDLLDHMLRVLGPDHSLTTGTRLELAYWQRRARGTARSVALEKILDATLRVLDSDPTNPMGKRHSLTYWRRQARGAGGPAVVFGKLLKGMLLPDSDRS